MMQTIELGQHAYLELWQRWLAAEDADALFAALSTQVPWQERTIRVYGRDVLQPRLVAWIGDADAVYTYSGTRHEPAPWIPALAALRARLNRELGLAFNGVLCNLYRDGRDSMGMHRDAEPELGPDPIVASISLGAVRRFSLRHRRGPAHGKLDLMLAHGSLLLMRGTTQRYYRHGVPKAAGLAAARINLTFRELQSFR